MKTYFVSPINKKSLFRRCKWAMGTNAFQEAPATLITKPVTKWSYFIKENDNVEEIIDKAFYIANNGKKGSVHIDIPKCVLNSNSKNKKNKYKYLYKKYNNQKNSYITSKPFEELVNIIYNSNKPILYVGQGANNSYLKVREISKLFHIPITTTLHGMGISDETDEYSLQMCGMHGHAAANYALQNADCIIALGSRFDDRTTGNVDDYFVMLACSYFWIRVVHSLIHIFANVIVPGLNVPLRAIPWLVSVAVQMWMWIRLAEML